MTTKEVTLAVVDEELESARAWAARVGVELAWLPENLVIRATLSQPRSGTSFYLVGRLEGYRLMPPIWDFRDEGWGGEEDRRNFPSNGAPPGIGSIFHPSAVICAPFNRLAYAGYSGLHSGWGAAQNWVQVAPGYVRADTIADMLATIQLHLNYSTGRLG